MKYDFPQKWTVYELSEIQKMWLCSKKSVFGKSVQELLNKKIKTDFLPFKHLYLNPQLLING